MIEGLRILPWLQERIRNDQRDIEHLLDCDACRGITKSNTVAEMSQIQRQCWGCPYEPRIDAPYGGWIHPGYRSETPTACPGYTTKLPVVIEINRARLAAKNNMLADFCDGERATESLIRGIEVLEGAANEAMCWRPESDK